MTPLIKVKDLAKYLFFLITVTFLNGSDAKKNYCLNFLKLPCKNCLILTLGH